MTFGALRVCLRLKKNLYFTYVLSWIYSKNKCGQSGIKIVYNYNNEDLYVEKCS